MTGMLLASCSATSDTDGTLFGFSPRYGVDGVPQDASLAASTEAAEPATEETASEQPSGNGDDIRLAAGSEPIAAETPPASSGPQALTADATPAAKSGFLSAFFSAPSRPAVEAVAAEAAEETTAAGATGEPAAQPALLAQTAAATGPIVDLQASRRALVPQPVAATQSRAASSALGGDALPGVRDSAGLFEITRRNGLDDDSDVDMYEGGLYQVAYAPGMARLAPNGLLTQHDKVDVSCLKPSLVRILRQVEQRFGKKIVVTSGFRSPAYNKRVGGARQSQHMACAAADIQVPGVDKMVVAEFVRSMPGRGGVGTYCHMASIHVDVGPERDWNWRCRGRARN